MKRHFRRWRGRKVRKQAEEYESEIKGKIVCEVVGHDWVVSDSTIYGSNVKEVERHCKRCGKKEKEVEPR